MSEAAIPYVGGPEDGKVTIGSSLGCQSAAKGRYDADGELLFHTYKRDGNRLVYLGLYPIGEPEEPQPITSPADSPALSWRSDHYPAEYEGRVPRTVRATQYVAPDGLILLTMSRRRALALRVTPGQVVPAWVNSHGAVAAILNGRDKLGLRPGELEVVDFHEVP